MSHTTAIKSIKITNVQALQGAVLALQQQGVGCALLEGGTPRAYYDNQPDMGPAAYVLKLNDAPYDVGFYHQPDGSLEPRTDFYGGHVERLLGGKATAPQHVEQARLGKLFMHYGVCVATEQAIRQGQNVTRNVDAQGNVQLVITGSF